ncbi:MAG: YcgL domain-containing protein [Aeromonas sp.]
MLCAVYKSPRKVQTYLFVERRSDFSRVPDLLLTTFGEPELIMLRKLSADKPLAGADVKHVIAALESQGFYLQLPPPVENLLNIHLAAQKKG